MECGLGIGTDAGSGVHGNEASVSMKYGEIADLVYTVAGAEESKIASACRHLMPWSHDDEEEEEEDKNNGGGGNGNNSIQFYVYLHVDLTSQI